MYIYCLTTDLISFFLTLIADEFFSKIDHLLEVTFQGYKLLKNKYCDGVLPLF